MASAVQALAPLLHSLGYPGAVPSDLHQSPSFEFVADCFAWLCQRIDPEVTAPRDYGSEQRRAGFLAALGCQLYARTRLKVDLRRLYRAGGSAARELVALATALNEAAHLGSTDATPAPPPNYVAKQQQRRAEGRGAVQQLAQTVAAMGQQLLGTLAQAPTIITQQLDAALAAGSNPAGLKAEVRAAAASTQVQVAALQRAIAELEQEQQSLEAKVEKRHVELDRMERRLDALHAIKPVQSEELDALEAELAGLYRAYLHKFRNLEYLEGQLDRYTAVQEAKAEEAERAMRKIQRAMREEEARVLQGDQNGDPNHWGAASSEDSEADFAAFEPKALPRLGGVAGGAGHGAMSDHLLLVQDDDSFHAPPRLSTGRMSGSSVALGAGLGRAASGASAPGSLRPSSAGSRRPSSAARRAGGSAAADVLVLEDMQRLGLDERASAGLHVDNDF